MPRLNRNKEITIEKTEQEKETKNICLSYMGNYANVQEMTYHLYHLHILALKLHKCQQIDPSLTHCRLLAQLAVHGEQLLHVHVWELFSILQKPNMVGLVSRKRLFFADFF
jgi:hypothetical protein